MRCTTKNYKLIDLDARVITALKAILLETGQQRTRIHRRYRITGKDLVILIRFEDF